MSEYMKKPCQHCPFRTDVKPFLHPERAYEIAGVSRNIYSSFPCHKTTTHDDDGELEDREAEKECAGMLTMRARESDRGLPEGFEPSWDMVYEDPDDMYEQYSEAWGVA